MLEIGLRRIKDIAVLDLSGSVDLDASNFVEKIGWCLKNGYSDIVCNFEGVTLIDYAGLTVVSIAYKNVVNHSARMKFFGISLAIKKLLSLVCLDRVFDIYDTEDAAVKSFEEDKAIADIQKKQLRRRFKRLPLDIDIAFKTCRDAEYQHGKILNISAVGMLVFTDKALPLGEILSMKLSLSPDPGTLEIQGKVVWLVEKVIQPQIYPGMGIEFYHLDSAVQKRIVEFVERNLPLNCSNE